MWPRLCFSLTFVLSIIGNALAFYTRSSPVLQVDSKSYDDLINHSNYTSIVEFYAPWCGHCQNLKRPYEKTAENLAGLAKVAAVNCDENLNKPLCSRMGVQGFPTLKIVTPGPKLGRPSVEDYRGSRTAKGMVDAVVEKIPNHVKRLQDRDLQTWLATNNDTAKAVLFSEKGTTSPLTRALAIDFLGLVSVAQVRSKEDTAVQLFGISKFPTLILLPGGQREPKIYEGEMKKGAMASFLRQAITSGEADSQSEILPKPDIHADHQAVMKPEVTAPVPVLTTSEELESACLRPTAGTCVLALLPPRPDPETGYASNVEKVLHALAELVQKHSRRKTNLFPVYAIPGQNHRGSFLKNSLGLEPEVDLHIIAINSKKLWWMGFDNKDDLGSPTIESFLDRIRMGEAKKNVIPPGIILPNERGEDKHVEL